MAIRNTIIKGGNGINITKEVDGSADHAALDNNTYFRDLQDGLIKWKDGSGTVIDIFEKAASGVVGISDANGVYTYYATLQAAITAASAGDTVEVFADIVETGAVTVVLKDGVKVNGNGHTYTLDNASSTIAFDIQAAGTTHYVSNLIIRKINSTGAACFNSYPRIGCNIYLDNVKVYNNLGGAGDFANSTLYGGYFYSSDVNTSVTVLNGTYLYDCIAEGESLGIRCFEAWNCKAKSNSYRAFEVSTAYNCTAHSDGNYAFYKAAGSNGSLYNCTGVSTVSNGMFVQGAPTYELHNCTFVGATNAFSGNSTFARAYNCSFIGTLAMAVGGVFENCKFKTTADVGIQIRCDLINCSVETTWNDVSGHASVAPYLVNNERLINCYLKNVNNTAYGIKNGNPAYAPVLFYSSNVFDIDTSPVLDVNIQQGIVNSTDNQGNISI